TMPALQLNTCTNAPNQQFSFVNIGLRGPPSVLVARHSGRCLDVPNSGVQAGDPIQQFYCHGNGNQQVFTVSATCPSGFSPCQSLKFSHSQKCITVTGIG